MKDVGRGKGETWVEGKLGQGEM